MSWSVLAPVGGIPIVRNLALYLHPVRFKLEERVGHEIVDYIFNDRVKRRKQGENSVPLASRESSHSTESSKQLLTVSGTEMPSLDRIKSTSSLKTLAGAPKERIIPDAKFGMVPIRDAVEMRRRASANKTFIRVIFGSTSIVLSYKVGLPLVARTNTDALQTDDDKKHSTFSLPDCVDFKLKTPEMIYGNKVWAYEDVYENVKRGAHSVFWT